MLIIDCHAHVYSDDPARYPTRPATPALGRVSSIKRHSCHSARDCVPLHP